ncbi:MAG: transposase, partial [Lachnospiraceae bacterium]|nr:transposase [Lachnospiraceae bacterium]
MYMDFLVDIPVEEVGISLKTIKGTTYVYYTDGRKYNSEKKYTVPHTTSIGKCAEGLSNKMYPNSNFLTFFPMVELPTEREAAYRSGCLRIGAFLVIRKLIAELRVDELLGNLLGKDSGLFLDLSTY